MSLSVQRSLVESFKFNNKIIRAVHVPDMGGCLVGIDESRAIGYVDDNTGKRAIKRHVPQKYMMRFEDIKDIVKRHVRSDVPQDDAILLKEPSLYCFLLRCKMPEVEPLEKDNQIQTIQYENMALQAKRDEYQAQLQRCQDTIIDLRTRYVDHARDPDKDNIIITVQKNNACQ